MRDRTTRSVSLEMNDRLETGRLLERISLSSDGFLRSGVTNECLKSRGKLPVDKESGRRRRAHQQNSTAARRSPKVGAGGAHKLAAAAARRGRRTALDQKGQGRSD